YRHPAETLGFFGLTPEMTVIELSPGGGWYTEILAPVLRGNGKLVAAIPSAEGPGARYATRFQEFLATAPELYDHVQTVVLEPPAHVTLGPDGSADLVLTFRNTHGWVRDGIDDEVYAAVFRVLKPGGIFGVVQHRAAEGADVAVTAEQGYVTEAHVIGRAQEAGFELVEKSEINANPNDTRDYPEGVWT